MTRALHRAETSQHRWMTRRAPTTHHALGYTTPLPLLQWTFHAPSTRFKRRNDLSQLLGRIQVRRASDNITTRSTRLGSRSRRGDISRPRCLGPLKHPPLSRNQKGIFQNIFPDMFRFLILGLLYDSTCRPPPRKDIEYHRLDTGKSQIPSGVSTPIP